MVWDYGLDVRLHKNDRGIQGFGVWGWFGTKGSTAGFVPWTAWIFTLRQAAVT